MGHIVSLPNAVGTIGTPAHQHLAVHVELHRLHSSLLLVPTQNQLLLPRTVVEQVYQGLVSTHCQHVT